MFLKYRNFTVSALNIFARKLCNWEYDYDDCKVRSGQGDAILVPIQRSEKETQHYALLRIVTLVDRCILNILFFQKKGHFHALFD